MSLRSYLASWAETTLPHLGLRASSVEAYRYDIHHVVVPLLGETRLDRFDAPEAERWLTRLGTHRTRAGKPLAASSQRRAFSTLSRALGTAVRDGLIAENPLTKVKRPRAVRVEVPVHSAEALDSTLRACEGRRVQYLALTAAFTGARVSELLALDWDDLDLRDQVMHIRDGKSAAARRAVPLVPRVVEGLHTWRAQQAAERLRLGDGWQADDAVFTTGRGARVNIGQARRDLRVALRAAGVDSRRPWHTMRHSLATRLLTEGIPMPVVSAILGHASIGVTVDVYGHVKPALAAQAMARALA